MTSPISVEVIGPEAKAIGPFPLDFLKVLNSLIGKKEWAGKSMKFEPMPINLNILRRSGFKLDWKGPEFEKAKVEGLLQKLELSSAYETVCHFYQPKLKLREHQTEALIRSWDKEAYALFLEMGLGKTAIMIGNAGLLYKLNKLSGVVVLAPKGVHRQWLEEQIPEHLDPSIEPELILWNKKQKTFKKTNKLQFFALNIDAVRTKDGFKAIQNFLITHQGTSMMIVDESHNIKSWMADRTKAAIKLGTFATYRRIATGTPISRDIMDAYSQFLFLDANILGHRSPVTFRSRYCVMGGWEMRQVVGQKNIEEFYSLIAPYSFRLTKAEAVDLPPKIYVKREYALSEKARKHYDELRKTFMTSLENGERVDVNTAMSAMLRLQQIVCGYLPLADGSMHSIDDGRIEQTLEIISQVQGQVVIWARFREDIKRLKAALEKAYKKPVGELHGDISDKLRAETLRMFQEKEIDHLVANPTVGGVGVNQMKKCPNFIYYSNSFNALDRWQSEDRGHRYGTEVSPTYFDLVAEKTIDRIIVKNLQSKKSLSDLTLDQIRQAVSEGEL